MKKRDGSFIRNSIFILIGFLTLSSCSNEIDDLVIGEWSACGNNFLITLNKDFDFVDIYSKPWKGSVLINNEIIKTDNYKYFIDNALGDTHIYSDSINFDLYSGGLDINYNNLSYDFLGSFTLNPSDGKFTANGIAVKGDKQFKIEISIDAQHTYMKKDIQYEIKDGAYFLKFPIEKISFQNNGKLKCSMMDIDILYAYSGDWRIKSDKLFIDIDEAEFYENYTCKLAGSDTLELVKDVKYSDYQSYAIIPETYVNELKYKSVFLRD